MCVSFTYYVFASDCAETVVISYESSIVEHCAVKYLKFCCIFTSYPAICEYGLQHLSSQHVSTETAAVRQNTYLTLDTRTHFE